MNAERLHALAAKLLKEYTSRGVIKVLGQIADHVQTLVNNPADTNAQQQVASLRENLTKRLSQVETDHSPPTIRKMILDLGLGYFFGDALEKTINAIFDRNKITPAFITSARRLSRPPKDDVIKPPPVEK